MTELTQPTQRERTAPGGGGLGSLFADNHEPAGLVTVAVGPYVERLPLGNNTVAQIRARFGLRFDIDPRSQAVLDGHEVGDDTVVRTGQVLMFVHKSGEKGAAKLQISNPLDRSGAPRGHGSLPQSRSDLSKVAVGFSPRWERPESPRRGATLESQLTPPPPASSVASRRELLRLDPWAEAHGYRQSLAPRGSQPNLRTQPKPDPACANFDATVLSEDRLELEAWSFFGTWSLELGTSPPAPCYG
jgi:hypothetical protein